MTLKIGQIVFLNDKVSTFGKAIRLYNIGKFKRSDATHVGIIAKVEGDDIWIFEAGSKGFKCSAYSERAILNEEMWHIGEVNIKLKNVYENCQKYENIKYGWLDIFAIGASFLFGWRVLGITGKNALICSEAISRVLYDCSDKKIDFEKEYGIKYDAITPEHMFLSKQVRIIK